MNAHSVLVAEVRFWLLLDASNSLLTMSTKRKLPSKLAHPVVKPSARPAIKTSLDDSKAVVVSGVGTNILDINGDAPVVDISSDSSSDDEDGDSSEGDDTPQIADRQKDEDAHMTDNDDEGSQGPEPADPEEQQGEPTFGDLVLADTSEPIDVAGAFADSNLQPLSYPQSVKLEPPPGASLGTVLTQALQTNDVALLESCLQTPDATIIRATIQRLESRLAAILLHRLAERLHNRPGRAGALIVWVQWTLVTHGGFLATQPDLIKKLAELNLVIDERTRGLTNLLSLKGKLDMLEAQMKLRQAMRQDRRALDDEDDKQAIIYVEGDYDDGQDSIPPSDTLPNGTKYPPKQVQNRMDLSEDESEASEHMPSNPTNGVIDDSADDSEEDEEEDGDSEDDDLIDDEAEETDADTGDEDEEDEEEDEDDSNADDLEDEDDSDDAAAASAPSKMQKRGELFSRTR